MLEVGQGRHAAAVSDAGAEVLMVGCCARWRVHVDSVRNGVVLLVGGWCGSSSALLGGPEAGNPTTRLQRRAGSRESPTAVTQGALK